MIDTHCKDLDIYTKKTNQKIKHGNSGSTSSKAKSTQELAHFNIYVK